MSNAAQMPNDVTAEMIIVGAGLSGLLTAWRCLDVNPTLRIFMIESSDKIAGDHTWSFNRSDVPDYLQDWIKPFIAYQWDSYDVKFPKFTRHLNIAYCTGNSETLRACVKLHRDSGRLQVWLNTQVINISANDVTLESGEILSAQCVLDARGFEARDNVFLGYQKFVGHVIKTPKPHGVTHPIIMDATVPQLGGYRFVYCLPYTDTEILVEDTYYTDGANLKSQEVDARIKAYILDNLGLRAYETIRREKGVLPITLAAKAGAYHSQAIGIRGGFYHAVTGYSFPDALFLADKIAHNQQISHRDKWRSENFLRLLNRMLFRAAKPEARYKVLQRFYGLNEDLIERFYRNRLTKKDKLRILAGKPPVPVTKALFNFSEKAFIKRERVARNSTSKALR